MNKNSKRILIWSVKTFVLICAFLLGFLIFLLFLVPNVAELYADFGGELPVLTRVFFNMGHFLKRYWYLAVPLLFLLATGLSFLTGFFLNKLKERVAIVAFAIVVILLGFLTLGFAILVIYIPIYGLSNVVA